MKLKKLIKLVVIEILMDFIELEYESLKFELIPRCENDEISSLNILEFKLKTFLLI